MKDKKISAGFENYVVFLGPPPPGDEEQKKISYMINQLPHRVIRFLKNVILMLEKSIFTGCPPKLYTLLFIEFLSFLWV